MTGATTFDTVHVTYGVPLTFSPDPIAPTLTVPPAITRTTVGGAATLLISDATLGTATATDNVAGVTVSRTGVPAGNLFPVGVTTITWTATDVFGNKTVGTQLVTVLASLPVVTIAATDAAGAEQGTDPIVFTVTRIGIHGGRARGAGVLRRNGVGDRLRGHRHGWNVLRRHPDYRGGFRVRRRHGPAGRRHPRRADRDGHPRGGRGVRLRPERHDVRERLDHRQRHAPPALPTVTITATDAAGAEQGTDPIVFTVTRTGSTAAALAVQRLLRRNRRGVRLHRHRHGRHVLRRQS